MTQKRFMQVDAETGELVEEDSSPTSLKAEERFWHEVGSNGSGCV